jgi:hypothetical protein
MIFPTTIDLLPKIAAVIAGWLSIPSGSAKSYTWTSADALPACGWNPHPVASAIRATW